MTDKNHTSSDANSRWSRLAGAIPRPTRTHAIAVLFAFMMVSSIAVMPLANGFDNGVASAGTGELDTLSSVSDPQFSIQDSGDEDADVEYYEDFEDGSVDGWETQDDVSTFDVVTDGFYGDQSLTQTATEADDYGSQVFWTAGPEFNTQDNFEITGTYKAEGSSRRHRLGLMEPETAGSGAEGAMIVHSHEHDSIFLATHHEESPADTGDIIETAYDGWLEYRLQFDGGSARAKVWKAGTSEPTEWQLDREYEGFDGKFFASPGWIDDDRQLYVGQVDAGGYAISGQFVDQNGDPVPNATVEGLGVDYIDVEARLEEQADDFEGTAEELEVEAERLFDEAEGVELPEEWQNFESEFQSGDSHILDISEFTDGVDGRYILVNQADDWGEGGTDIFSSEVGEAKLQLAADQDVVISVWDLEDGNLIMPEGPVSNSHPGGITEGTVVIEEYSASSITSSTTEETESEFVVERALRSDQEIPAVRKSLSPGVYTVYLEDKPELRYTFTVGDAEDQWNAFETELRSEAESTQDEAGELVDRAEGLVNNIDIGEMERRTTTTDENGEFEIRFQTGVQRAAIQGYRADGTILTDITGPNFNDLRTAAEGGYNGTYYLSAPERYEVPKQDVTIEGFRADELPNHPIDTFEEFLEWKNDQILNETLDEFRSEYDQKFEEMNRTVLEATYEGHKKIIEINPRAEERYLERSDFDSVQDADDLTTDELAEEMGHMQVAVTGIDQIMSPGDGSLDITDGELTADFPLPDGIDTDTISPELHWSDGTHEEIPEEYWSIDSGSSIPGFGGQTLSVDGFPIDTTDPAAFDLRVMGGGESGFFDGRIGGSNPAFDGLVPDVRAVDLNTMSPGQDERVSMTFRPGDNSFDSIDEIEVFGPDGNAVEAGVTDDDRAYFRTNGVGQHHIRATVLSDTGDPFTQTFQIAALEDSRSDYPTVRAEKATGDRLIALAGEGLRDAEIAVDDDRVGITAIVPAGETPSRVDVKPGPAIDSETGLDIRVLEGSDEQTIDTKIETVIHFDSLPEDAAIWRGDPAWVFGDPMSVGETERYGEVIERENGKIIIRTYTESDGSLSLYVNSDPDWGEATKHSVASIVPSINIPLLSTAAGAVGSVGGAFGIGLFVRRRRLT